jgi:type IV secretion system protein VirB2
MKNAIAIAGQRLKNQAYGKGLWVVQQENPGRLVRALAFGAVLAYPALAHAETVAGGASPTTMINNVCTFILGPFGQSLAVLGIIAIGLSWMFGRVSLGLIAGVIGGIVIMFGASYLGSTLTGSGSGG